MPRSRCLPEGTLWFPQICSDKAPDSSSPVTAALGHFCALFEIKVSDHVVPNPLIWTKAHRFSLQPLLDFVSDNARQICVLGTSSKADAVKLSWSELGLNLFDLPWFNPEKAFRYIPLFSLAGNLKELLDIFTARDESKKSACEQASLHLRWARCHQFSRDVQKAVGHGERNRLQGERWPDILTQLKRMREREEFRGLPCGENCRLKSEIDDLLTVSDQGDEQIRLALAQKVASLECQAYRLSQAKYFVSCPAPEEPRFEKIIILEDDRVYREFLKEELKRFGEVEIADRDESLKRYRLCDREGNDIVKRLINDSVAPSEILACFDLDLGTAGAPLAEIFGGHWIMYGTACAYPDVPRLIITGYRSQDVLGFAAGGCAYLLKPLTKDSLETQIKNASILRRVKWLCLREVQNDYSSQLHNGPSFAMCGSLLGSWLGDKRIDLEVIDELEKLTDQKIAESDLIIIDIFTTKDEKPVLDPLNVNTRIRHVNGQACLLALIPSNMNVETLVSDYYRNWPLALRDGSDAIIKKPMWIVADGSPKAEDGLGNAILRQLELLDTYDVKYQILVPVAAVIGRCDKLVRDFKDLKGKKESELDELYAPLLPFLVNTYGLSGRLGDISEPEHKERLAEYLREVILREVQREPGRWKGLEEKDISDMCSSFAKNVQDKDIKRYLTLESWLRKMVDQKVKGLWGIDTLTEPLTRVFGGATRYEFSIKGSWYESVDQPIQDMLIVVEFCAKSSIAARKFIKETVVRYLTEIAGEKCVLVQEIPIRGFFW